MLALLEVGSTVLALCNVAICTLLALKMRSGWMVSMISQVPWTYYDIATHQYGLLITGSVTLAIAFRAWRKWDQPAPLPPGGGPQVPSSPGSLDA